MTVRDGLKDSHSLEASEFEYRPLANESRHPCFNCSEGNHNIEICHQQVSLQCRQCFFHGHKEKHCPDSVHVSGHEESTDIYKYSTFLTNNDMIYDMI